MIPKVLLCGWIFALLYSGLSILEARQFMYLIFSNGDSCAIARACDKGNELVDIPKDLPQR
jgi:hypothetical protein